MNISLIYFTKSGGETCRKIEAALTADGHCCTSSEGRGLPGGLTTWTQEAFTKGDALVFVSATGIAVRAIAPYIKSKTTDPAVVVVDEKGIHAISLLSGHLGGANELTLRIAQSVGADPVITTATDVNGRFAVDEWAKKQGLAIADMKLAKEVSAALLRHEPVGFYSEYPVDGELPEGLIRISGEWAEEKKDRVPPGIGIAVSLREPAGLPFDSVLWLMPRRLTLGIGCRKGVPEAVIRDKVSEVLNEQGLREAAAVRVASIDLKKEEQGLIDFSERLGLSFEVYSAEELSKVSLDRDQVPEQQGSFTASEFVRSVTGVDNVCERAAVLSAERNGDGSPILIVRKQAGNGVTVAAAADLTAFRICMK